jgi:hypothetical protein
LTVTSRPRATASPDRAAPAFRQAGRAEILALVLAGVTDQLVRADSGYPGRGLVPAQVSGQVSLAAGAPDRPAVAVAVDGVIAGVSETFRERRDAKGSQPVGPPDRFSALTLDTVYRKGENRLELFVIDDSGAGCGCGRSP